MDKERTSQARAADAGRNVEERLEPLTLASGSPRRAEILRAVGWTFEAQAADVDETLRAGESAEDYVRRLAREKAERVAAERLFGLVLGADTTVVCGGEILGKPRDEEDARRMLRLLSGRTHEVLTGVALMRAETKRCIVEIETTRVRFARIDAGEIDDYVRTREPLDKAGAYAIQGGAALFVEGVEGDFWNVVGLPVRLVYRLARELDGA